MKRVVIVIILVALSGGLLGLSLFVLPSGEAAIVTQFGKPVATLSEPGLKWKLPGFLQRVNRIDIRIDVFNTKPIQLLLGDKNPIIITTFVAWNVTDPLLYYQSLILAETARQKLTDMVVSVLGSVLADYQLDGIINTDPENLKLSEIEGLVLERTRTQSQQKYGIDVVRVGFRRIVYPSIVADAVYNRMQSERQKEARKYRAEGMEEAAKIEASTDKEASELMARAYRDAEILKGQGDQEASRIYAESYGQDAGFFEFLKSLDLYSKTFKEGSTLILSTESPLFRYLDIENKPQTSSGEKKQ